MNFKEIQLVGFKSFADKTTIKFDDGVTCIVGPNGCGKSNVADAVRWVLGEQSAKTLRGSSMQDVIFGGTQTRRQLSFCEVTLVFDNTNRMFDIEYDEVAMTRRLYRSGESEYLLNMQPCRLKDIVALLHGVGIGKEGYSIIGQGKVEQIMNAKPEDRRAIFEEATGVMKFKAQKGEIERKLENAKDNLTVFVQRMDEAENQLRPLEKQAETAKKYRAYTEELRHEEVNTYLARYDNFAYETGKQREKIEKAAEQLASIEARLAALDTEENETREAIRKADEDLRSLNEKLRLFEVGMEHKTGEAKVLNERIQAYNRELRSASDDVEYSLRRTAEIDGEVKAGAARAKENAARAARIDHDCAALEKQLAELTARVTAFERISDEKRADELTSVENLADIRANAGSLTARRDAVDERIGEVNAALEKAQARRTEYDRQLAECTKERAACEKYLDEKPQREKELQEEISALERSRRKLSEDVVDCNTSILNLQNNLEMYVNLKNRFDGYRDSVRKLQLTARNDPEIGKRIRGAIADIVRTEKQYEVAIETAIGGAMQNLVTATQEDARWLIEYLKRTGGGIVTFLPVDAMRPRGNSREIRAALNEEGALGLADELVRYDEYYSNIVKYLLDNTLICDTIASATRIARKFPRSFKLVTLDGDTIASSGAMTGGSRRRESGNLLAGERHIKECEENIARKKAAMEKLKKALEACDVELEQAQAAYEAFRVKVQEQTASFAALSQRAATLEGLLADAGHDIAEYQALLEKLTRTADDLKNEVLSTEESEELLNRIRSEAAAETAARQAEGDALKKEQSELAERIHALRVERASIESAREADEVTQQRLQEEKASLLKKVDETRGNIDKTQQLIEQLKRDEERAALTDEEQATVARLRERLAGVEQEKRTVSENQSKLAEEKRGLLTRQMALSEVKHECELEISRAEASLENMKQRIDEAYGLTYESAQELRDENFDITQAASRINSLKHRIGALGAINQNAEEDYDNLLARYTEMQTQKEDLDKGIADLTAVLDELKAEMQKKFDDGFNEINANFSKIFRELFGGGKAEMQLDYTDCDDPLNAGIEIIVSPPGKKLSKISLLSGGERAFTAIAILFAILKSRPMPFCILDEIEAALDEANVDRFAKYLKKFSKETQFIVITHRKPTMNQADILFGVTMEEKGVSKVVSVKLSEVEEKLGGDTVI